MSLKTAYEAASTKLTTEQEGLKNINKCLIEFEELLGGKEGTPSLASIEGKFHELQTTISGGATTEQGELSELLKRLSLPESFLINLKAAFEREAEAKKQEDAAKSAPQPGLASRIWGGVTAAAGVLKTALVGSYKSSSELLNELSMSLSDATSDTQEIIDKNQKTLKEFQKSLSITETKIAEIKIQVDYIATTKSLEELKKTFGDLKEKLDKYDQSYIKYFYQLIAKLGFKTEVSKILESRSEITESAEIIKKYSTPKKETATKKAFTQSELDEISSKNMLLEEKISSLRTKGVITETSDSAKKTSSDITSSGNENPDLINLTRFLDKLEGMFKKTSDQYKDIKSEPSITSESGELDMNVALKQIMSIIFNTVTASI